MAAANIAEKMVRARERWIEIEGFRFLSRRPSDAELVYLRSRAGEESQRIGIELVRAAVVGWEGVKEIDLFPGGSSEPAEFHPHVWRLFVDDRPTLWNPLGDAIWKQIEEHNAETDALRKNSASSSQPKTSES